MYISFERYKKNIKLILVLILLLLVLGCGSNLTPSELNEATPPLKILIVNEEGIILIDKKGIIYSYSDIYAISKIIAGSDMKAGDIIVPTTE